MTSQGGSAGGRSTSFPAEGEFVELLLPLPKEQFSALVVAARRLNMTVGELLRRTIGECLRPPDSGRSP
jgi:hypothetical protein